MRLDNDFSSLGPCRINDRYEFQFIILHYFDLHFIISILSSTRRSRLTIGVRTDKILICRVSLYKIVRVVPVFRFNRRRRKAKNKPCYYFRRPGNLRR